MKKSRRWKQRLLHHPTMSISVETYEPLWRRGFNTLAKKGARQQTLGSTSRRMSRRPSTRFQDKAGCDCTATSSTRAVRRSRSGRISYSRRRSSRSRHFRKPPNMLTDHILQGSTTQRCGDRTFPSHASVRSIYNTDSSRRSPLPHCPSSGESITCRGGRYRNTCLGLLRRRFGHGHTRRRSSRNSQTRHRKTTRNKCSVWSDVESDRKSVQKCRWGVLRMTPMTVVSANIATLDPKAERAAARTGLHQGQRAEEPERMFDDAGADVIAPQEHRLQTTGQRCGGLFQHVYSSASPQGTFGVALWFLRSRFNQFELAANAVSPRILSVCMISATQCFRFVVAHSPHSCQAADQVAMDIFHTELLSVTSPQNP